MAAVDSILDSELREELKSFGLNVGPITKTTKVILIKKLNHLRAAARKEKKTENAKLRKDRDGGKFFSSDEGESDQAPSTSFCVTSKAKTKRRRSTSRSSPSISAAAAVATNTTNNNVDGAAASTSTTRTRRTSSRARLNDSSVTTSSPTVKSVAKKYSLRTSASPASNDKNNSIERYSDSDEDETATTATAPKVPAAKPSSSAKPQYANFSLNSTVALPPISGNSSWSNTTAATSRKRYHKLSQIGKLSRTGSPLPDSSAWQPPFPRRLVSALPMPGRHAAGNHVSAETEARLQREFARADEGMGRANWLNCVPMVLKTTAMVFLVVLVSSYLAMRFSTFRYNGGSSSDQNFSPVCATHGNRTEGFCLETQEEADEAMKVLNLLYGHLSLLAGSELCGYGGKNNLTWQEAEAFVRENLVDTVDSTLANSLELIVHNPEWKIRAYNSSGQLAQSAASAEWLRSESPALPLFCQIIRAINKVFYQILVAIVVVLGVWIIYKVLQWRQLKEEELVRSKYDLVERIIYTLENHARASREDKQLSPYLAIPHVRDMLIWPQDRSSKQGLWESAVKFLARNESRVRTESQVIAGENFAVWRWIGVSTPPLHHRDLVGKKRRVWQGSALENVEAAVERPNKETSCLQIKNMFDASIEFEPRWPASVEKALKEKCGDSSGIVRVTVDKESLEGCVFVKCSSEKVAHRVYNSLHGSYLDGRLVSAKYISPERYAELGLPEGGEGAMEQACTIL